LRPSEKKQIFFLLPEVCKTLLDPLKKFNLLVQLLRSERTLLMLGSEVLFQGKGYLGFGYFTGFLSMNLTRNIPGSRWAILCQHEDFCSDETLFSVFVRH
jgi:hypothetical protein